MQRYIAFISGLPLGREPIGMDDLRSAFIKLGFSNVESYMTSGNVGFDSAPVGVTGPLEAQISRHLRRTFKTDDVWTFIRTSDEVREIVRDLPFDTADVKEKGNCLFVVLLSEEPDDLAVKRLRIKRTSIDELRLSRREIYWLRRRNEGEPVAPPPISEILNAPATVRSLATLQRIVTDQTRKAKPAVRIKLDDATESERSRP